MHIENTDIVMQIKPSKQNDQYFSLNTPFRFLNLIKHVCDTNLLNTNLV